jgi:hypothetical protein
MTKLLWHEPSNTLAVYDDSEAVTMLTVLDEDWDYINPLPCYLLLSLGIFGWQDLGELE